VEVVLETERLRLRRFTDADADALVCLYCDPRVMRFITPDPPTAYAVRTELLPRHLREYEQLSDGLGCFAAIERVSATMVGSFSLRPANSYGLADGIELGYRLHPDHWGRGLATEGARALIAHAFGQLHSDRVVATTMADNTGSWRVLEKCGLRRTGSFHYPDAHLMPGGENGDHVYEITRGEWDSRARVSSRAREN
jgi:RimJ/RimL family protein N-acetyltransferase